MRTTPPPLIDIAQIFPELADKAKTTVRLHPRRGPEPGSRESKMGGLFLWPADEPWPVCDVPEGSYELGIQEIIDINHPEHNDYYTTVLQLRKDDFPELQFPGDTNLFQLLWCPRDHAVPYVYDYCPVLKVYWRKEEDIINPITQTPSPKKPVTSHLLQHCYLNPERVIEYPSAFELSEEFYSKILEWEGEDREGLYEEELSVADGTKLGGYVQWIQGAYECLCKNQHEMEHLLTIASWEYSGSIIPPPRWLPLEDHTEVEDSFNNRSPIREPAGIMLGDTGSIFVFICRKCPEWPIEWIFQCC